MIANSQNSKWTGAKVREEIETDLTKAVRGEAEGEMDVDGLPPVINLICVSKVVLPKGCESRAHFDTWIWIIMTGEQRSDILRERGWASTTHDRKVRKACDLIANWLNYRLNDKAA